MWRERSIETRQKKHAHLDSMVEAVSRQSCVFQHLSNHDCMHKSMQCCTPAATNNNTTQTQTQQQWRHDNSREKNCKNRRKKCSSHGRHKKMNSHSHFLFDLFSVEVQLLQLKYTEQKPPTSKESENQQTLSMVETLWGGSFVLQYLHGDVSHRAIAASAYQCSPTILFENQQRQQCVIGWRKAASPSTSRPERGNRQRKPTLWL